MWNAWLDKEVSQQDYLQEAIEGGSRKQSFDTYKHFINQSIQECYRVLKWNRWMSFVFSHKDPKYWHLIIEAAQKQVSSMRGG